MSDVMMISLGSIIQKFTEQAPLLPFLVYPDLDLIIL